MTKEQLIALSDLNREDNIKYISFEAQGIAITLDSDRYAPTLCKLERAYICGRRKSEEQIAELEKEIAELKADNGEWEKASDKWKSVYYLTNDQLTEAKEIIRELLLADTRKGSDWTGYLIDLKERAEQFLNSEVKNDKEN